jgi:hypothetical protein
MRSNDELLWKQKLIFRFHKITNNNIMPQSGIKTFITLITVEYMKIVCPYLAQ